MRIILLINNIEQPTVANNQDISRLWTLGKANHPRRQVTRGKSLEVTTRISWVANSWLMASHVQHQTWFMAHRSPCWLVHSWLGYIPSPQMLFVQLPWYYLSPKNGSNYAFISGAAKANYRFLKPPTSFRTDKSGGFHQPQ